MKLLGLDLRAFGPFSGLALDLSGGREGLHVIYGPNEAGKSSALRAIEQALFGIPTRSTDDFIHSYQNLRIGATLASANGQTLSFLRRKGSTHTLLQADGVTPLDDSLLRPLLGGLDRDLFGTMFGIDHPRLVQGGREILHGSGSVGQVLFAAGAGIADLQAVQDGLQKQADALFARRAQNRPINQTLKALDEARRTARQAQLPSDLWTEHDQRLSEARTRRQGVEEQLEHCQREMSRWERIRQALPAIAQRRQYLAERAALGEVVILPDDFADQRRQAMKELEIARRTQQNASEEIERIDDQLQTLLLPEALLTRAEEIRKLPDALGSHRKAQRDLPGLRARCEQLEADAAAILRQFRPGLSLEMADQTCLTSAQQAVVRDLGGRCEALARGLEQARQEIQETGEQLAEEQLQLDRLEPPRDPAALKNALQRTQSQGDLEGQLSKAQAELRRSGQQAAAELKRLPLWHGTLEELEKLAVPAAETIDRYEKDLADVEQRLRAADDKRRESEAARADFERRLEQSRLEGDVPSEQDLVEARRVRDLGWQLVLQAWRGAEPDVATLAEFLSHFPAGLELPGAYEQAVHAADERADRLRREAGRVATRASLLAGRDAVDRQIAALDVQLAEIGRQQAELQQAWQQCWQPLGIEPGRPREMRAWQQRSAALLQQAEAIRHQQIAVEEARANVDSQRTQLACRLTELGEIPSVESETLAALLGRCQGVVERIESVAAARQQLAKSVRGLQNRLATAEGRARRAEGELAEWQGRWAAAVEPLGLPGTALPAAANAILGQMTDLVARLKEVHGVRERIDGIVRDAEAFRERVQSVARPVDPDLAALPAEQAADELTDRLQHAQLDRQKQQTLEQQRERYAAEIQRAKQANDRLSATLQAMCREAGCDNAETLPQVERASEAARRLDERLSGLNDQLLSLGAGASIDALIASAEAVDADGLPGELDRLRTQITELEAQRKELSETIGGEESTLRSLPAGSQAVEAAEDVQDLLARLESDVHQYVRLRLASAVLREGIERYRRKNEGPVLRRASELFQRLTLGRFERLSADCDEQGQQVLQGVRAGDGTATVGLSGMSEGTSDQLYLALRLASLESYLEGREPIPFIVDDVLISFDNERAAAALAILAELSQRTQIIFFTHHAHLVDLARQQVPADALFVHTLDTP